MKLNGRRWIGVMWLLVAGILPAEEPATLNAFPEPHDTEKEPGQPLAPDAAAQGFRVPEGFRVTVFASEQRFVTRSR